MVVVMYALIIMVNYDMSPSLYTAGKHKQILLNRNVMLYCSCLSPFHTRAV